jgi:lysosomal acid lipase/cholesteryl ester hydrolase
MDVWLGNNRCVFEGHMYLTPNDEKYWDWCIDELAQFDFPAMIQYVTNKTQKKIVYIGHSQGNSQAFLGLCLKPEIASNLMLFVALAPAVFINPPK